VYVRDGADMVREIPLEPTDVVRPLRGADVPTYVERVRMDEGACLVVVERIARVGLTDQQAAECVREAETAATLEHENLVRTRGILVRRDEISIASDYLDGERLSELWHPATDVQATFPLGVLVRILLDVLTGLGALHKLRDKDEQHRLRIIHGQVTPANVFVGLDGVSRLLRVCRVKLAGVPPTKRFDTLAPEILSGAAADQRADVFSVGAMLHGALTGRLPMEGATKNRSTHLRTPAAVSALVGSEAAWARPLFDIAARARAEAPDKRFPTAAAMATEMRKVAGSHLATTEQVAEFVRSRAGEKIAARRVPDTASRTMPNARSKRAVEGAPVVAIRSLCTPAPVTAASPVEHVGGESAGVAHEGRALPSKITTLQMPALHRREQEAAPAVRAPIITESRLVHTPEPMKALHRRRPMLAAIGTCLTLLVLFVAFLIAKPDQTSEAATPEGMGSAASTSAVAPAGETPSPSPEVSPASSASAAKVRKAKPPTRPKKPGRK
jgi:hypothetical protein